MCKEKVSQTFRKIRLVCIGLLDKCSIGIQAIAGILVSFAAALLLDKFVYYLNHYIIGHERDQMEWSSVNMPSLIISVIVIGFGLWIILGILSRERRLDREERRIEAQARRNDTQSILDAIRDSGGSNRTQGK